MYRQALVCFACLASYGSSARAQSVENFYRQSGLTIVVGYPPGTVYDLYARLMSRHIGKHIPGSPTVVVQNLPGAGSMKAANTIYNLSPKDGSQIATFARGLPMQKLLDEQGVQYDALRLNWLGSLSSEVSLVMAWAATPFKRIEDAMSQEMVVPATGTGADSAIFPYVLNGTIGTRFKVILGYAGASETLLAVERGEAAGSAAVSWGNFAAAKADWLREKKVNLLLQLSLKKHTDLPNVPLVMDYAQSDADRQTLALIFSRQLMAYPFAAPPGVPAERLAALRTAFEALGDDPEFSADANKMGLELDLLSGPKMTSMIEATFATAPEVIARTRASIQNGIQRTERDKR